MPICVREGMSIPRTRRFVPNDLVLVKRFFRRKIANLPLSNDAIFEFDAYGTEPWNVPDVYGPGEKIDKEAPWFQPEPKKIIKEGYKGYYFARSSTKRKQLPTVIKSGTGGGYWKMVNRGHRDIRDKKNNKLVGSKRTFVFFRFTDKKKKTEKTDWILNEYSLNSKKFQPWVLCSVRNKLEYAKAYLTDDKDKEFLQQDEHVTKLVDGIEKIDIRNIENAGGTKQFLQQDELITKLVDGIREIDIRNIEDAGGSEAPSNPRMQTTYRDIMEEEVD